MIHHISCYAIGVASWKIGERKRMVIVMTMEREEMVMFEPMVAQEEVVWTNHDGPLHFTFTKIQDVSSHFFFILHSPSLWFS